MMGIVREMLSALLWGVLAGVVLSIGVAGWLYVAVP
jgi:hypothetical protein